MDSKKLADLIVERVINILKESDIDNNFTIVGYVKGSNVQYAIGDFYILVDSDFDYKNTNNVGDVYDHLYISRDKYYLFSYCIVYW